MYYILVTLAKNEEKNLPKLAMSLISQTIVPTVWLIVNDNSTDKTGEIAKELSCQNSWIYYIQSYKIHRYGLSMKKYQNHSSSVPESGFGFNQNYLDIREKERHFAVLLNEAFNYVLNICNKNGIIYEYIGKVDADVILYPDTYEKLIKKFEQNPKLGVASVSCMVGCRLQTPRLPTGGMYLFRRECFKQVRNIFGIIYDIDAIIISKAIFRGWEARVFTDIHFFKTGRVSLAQAKRAGFKSYVLNVNPFLILCNIVFRLCKGRFRETLLYINGYLCALLRKEKKITDVEVKYYYRHMRLQEVIDTATAELKKCLLYFARRFKRPSPIIKK